MIRADYRAPWSMRAILSRRQQCFNFGKQMWHTLNSNFSFCARMKLKPSGHLRSKMVTIVRTAMLLCDDVFNVVREIAVLLAEQAILAAIPRPSSDEVSRGSVHR